MPTQRSSTVTAAKKNLNLRIAAAQKQADAAKREAKLAKLGFRSAKQAYKDVRRAARKLRKGVKKLKAELAALAAKRRKPAPRRSGKTVAGVAAPHVAPSQPATPPTPNEILPIAPEA